MCSMRWRVGVPFCLKYSDPAVRRVNGGCTDVLCKKILLFGLHCRTRRKPEPGPGQDNPLWVSNSFLVVCIWAEIAQWHCSTPSHSLSNSWHISIISTCTFSAVLKIKTTTWTWILLANPRWLGSVRAILPPQQIPCRFSTVDLMHGALEEHQDLKNESWKVLHSRSSV